MINPFYWLELRIRSREKRLWIIALFFLLSVLLFGGGILALSLVESSRKVVPGELGMAITYTLLFWHGAILVVLGPLASAGRLAQEREQRTLPALLNTSSSRGSIVWGKLLGTWTFILWLTALLIPLLAIALAWGGVPVWQAVGIVLCNILVSMVLSSVALGFSGLFGRTLTAYLVSGSFMLAWMVVFPILGMIGNALCDRDADTAREIVNYAFLYHHPFFPAMLIASNGFDGELPHMGAAIACCVIVWLLLALGGAALAMKGLKKEVY